MSDTPITDAALWEHEENGDLIVSADFARRLERDRAELMKALEGLLSMLEPVANSEKLADEYINAAAILASMEGE